MALRKYLLPKCLVGIVDVNNGGFVGALSPSMAFSHRQDSTPFDEMLMRAIETVKWQIMTDNVADDVIKDRVFE